jgi:hypothetical protein
MPKLRETTAMRNVSEWITISDERIHTSTAWWAIESVGEGREMIGLRREPFKPGESGRFPKRLSCSRCFGDRRPNVCQRGGIAWTASRSEDSRNMTPSFWRNVGFDLGRFRCFPGEGITQNRTIGDVAPRGMDWPKFAQQQKDCPCQAGERQMDRRVGPRAAHAGFSPASVCCQRQVRWVIRKLIKRDVPGGCQLDRCRSLNPPGRPPA